MRHGRHIVLAAGLWLAATGSDVVAQQPHITVDPEIPSAVRTRVDSVLSSADPVSIADSVVVPRGLTREAALVQVGGTVILEGRVAGDVTAIGSQVYVRPGAVVEGRLTVFAGGLFGSTLATVRDGEEWVRDAPLEVVIDVDGNLRIAYVEPERPFPVEPKGFFGFVPYHYTDVNGLAFSIAVGLRQRPEWPRMRLSGGPVFRTARGEVGWDVELAREFSEDGSEIGVRTYSRTDTSQRWHRGNLGNSLRSLFFADDDRLYFEREGYEAWGSLLLMPSLRLRIRWRQDDFDSLETEAPFAFFGGDEDWRVNPPITPGEGRALGARLTLDARDSPRFARRGVYADVQYNHWGFGGDFEFDWAQAEARGYLPTGGGSFAAMRVVGGGRLGGGDRLEPQFLYSLGGRRTVVGTSSLAEQLTGDRMLIANVRYHQALPSPIKRFQNFYAVGLFDIGDAWFPGDSFNSNIGVGGGVAFHGPVKYLGAFVAYGVDSDEWKLYGVISPWF
jgi:hypothetical protein